MANFYGNDPFFNNDMDDVFNQLFRRMGNQNSERARYLVNGQSLTPDEFAQYRATGKLPQNNKTIEVSKDGKQAVKKGGILEKLGTNLTEQARDGLLDPVIGREKEIQETANTRVEQTIKQLKEKSNLTEDMKNTDMLYWVGMMNNYKNQAEEIVFNELIYV